MTSAEFLFLEASPTSHRPSRDASRLIYDKHDNDDDSVTTVAPTSTSTLLVTPSVPVVTSTVDNNASQHDYYITPSLLMLSAPTQRLPDIYFLSLD